MFAIRKTKAENRRGARGTAISHPALLRSILLTLGMFLAAGPSGLAGWAADRSPSRTQSVANYFHRSPDEINSLRDLGFGYGEIVKILVITDVSHRPLQDLLARNRQGDGWGTLCREQGLDPLAIKKQVDEVRVKLQIRTHPLGK